MIFDKKVIPKKSIVTFEAHNDFYVITGTAEDSGLCGVIQKLSADKKRVLGQLDLDSWADVLWFYSQLGELLARKDKL